MSTSTHLFERRPKSVAQGDDDRSYRLMIPSIVACLIATTVLLLRLYCRRSIKQSLWWDDYLIFIAYVGFTSIFLMQILLGMTFPNKSQGTSLGLGKHVAVVQTESPNTVTTIFHTLVPAEFSYVTSILFTKHSILAFYWRMFSVRSMTIAVRIMLAITTLWLIGSGTAALLSCVPLQKLWNPAVPGTCIKSRTLYIGAAIPNVITDFVILIIPLPYVWH
ncbi:hypothetical protein HYALB_00011356 [Hymenoscyphus albidus]|uniref:Rhodopsin domain-containing protein n=1 Tax=Hymenoscyphus albidus TaxID=595503 RepID=A0A9N9Q7C9_9HELO|nr:hypothetical protein HYALB_00011356 [Hymenoscyphus albidus]